MLKSKRPCFWAGLHAIALLSSACSPTKVISAHLGRLAQTCRPTSSRSIASIGKKLGLVGLSSTQQAEICRNPSAFNCTVRSFHPEVQDGKSSAIECAETPEGTGRVCMTVEKTTFSTRSAAQSVDTDPAALLPGGEFNRDEYRCLHRDLKDGNDFLALSEADQLSSALQGAQVQCKELLSQLQEP